MHDSIGPSESDGFVNRRSGFRSPPPAPKARKYGSAQAYFAARRARATETFLARFWAKVRKTDGCWEWTAAKDRDGYGYFGVKAQRRTAKAHRLSWELVHGDPGPLLVRHLCNNPGCVRPDHLALGTQLDNMADMVAAGRQTSGERNPRAKLTDAAAAEIHRRRHAGESVKALVAEFGITRHIIWDIATGRLWGHATGASR